MKYKLMLLAALAAASVTSAGAQDDAPAVKAPTAKERAAALEALKKLPDWSGIWSFKFGGRGGPPPSPTPEYDARHKTLVAAQAKGSDAVRSSNCLPPGMPQVMAQPYNVEFLFTPGRVTIIQEAYMQVRRVFTDGRAHPPELDPTFNGHSIGHWEGDTLVIDTVGINPVTLFSQTYFHSDQLHIVERIRLVDENTMEDKMTLEDPLALTKPWAMTANFTRHREWEQIEFICEENNRNPVDESGRTNYLLNK